MINQSDRYAAVSTDHASTPGKYIASEADDLAGAVHFARGGADVLPANGHPSYVEHSIDSANHFVGNGDHTVPGGLPSFEVTIDDSLNVSGNVHSIDEPHLVISSAADFADTPGIIQGSNAEPEHISLVDSLNSNDLSGLFDHTDNLSDGNPNPVVGDAFNPSLGHSFDSSQTDPIGLPEVFSDARGHGGGGGGSGGGTTPTPYDAKGTGIDIHITWDSSVGSAPTGFTTVVKDVADFFASSFQDLTHQITINIDVGYGEVDGMRMGFGALGESVTNLQGVTDAQLTSAYSASGITDVSLGDAPTAGNLYVSFAEAKALGISVPNTIDGYVGFSSQSNIFDFGITSNTSTGSVPSSQYDFFGVVAHEFSEVMGRILLAGASINGSPSYMAYDLFHYLSGAQDFSGNGGYFSTDLGKTILAYFNNSSNGGDAGDWASSGTSGSPVTNTSGGINGSTYDAFNAFGTPGTVTPVTNTDLWALHAVGFDLAQHTITA